jgi:hypothetical protein
MRRSLTRSSLARLHTTRRAADEVKRDGWRMRNRPGGPATEYDRSGRAIVGWIVWELSYDEIVFARRVYALWHAGLQHVGALLAHDGVLEDCVVTGPSNRSGTSPHSSRPPAQTGTDRPWATAATRSEHMENGQ